MSSVFEGLDFTPVGGKRQDVDFAQEQPVEQEGGDPFEGLDFTPYVGPEPEGLGGKLKRGAGRTVARSAEAIAGLGGDIQNFVEGLLTKGFGLVAGQERAEKASQLAKGAMGLIPGARFPTSRQVREQGTQALTGEALEPQTPGEAAYDEFVGDFATLAIPVKGKVPFMRALGTSLFGNLSKESVKALGGGEKAQTATKLGTMMMAGMLGRQGAKNYVNELQSEARQMIPESATTNARDLLGKLEKFEGVVRKGGISPQKTPALSLSRQLAAKIREAGGELPVDELPEFRKSINDFRFNKEMTDTGRFLLDRFDDLVNEELTQYGKTNPAFLNKYRDANIGFAGFKQSNKLARYISKKFDVTKLSPETAVIVGMHALSPKGAAGIAGAGLAAKGAQIFSRFAKNPVLQKYYLNVVNNAAKDNAAGMIRNLEKMDEQLRKESSAPIAEGSE
jgi:hypothetical protein